MFGLFIAIFIVHLKFFITWHMHLARLDEDTRKRASRSRVAHIVSFSLLAAGLLVGVMFMRSLATSDRRLRWVSSESDPYDVGFRAAAANFALDHWTAPDGASTAAWRAGGRVAANEPLS